LIFEEVAGDESGNPNAEYEGDSEGEIDAGEETHKDLSGEGRSGSELRGGTLVTIRITSEAFSEGKAVSAKKVSSFFGLSFELEAR
jgi:hypothetical protein